MVSTPAQLLQTSLLCYRITGRGWGGGMVSTPAQLCRPACSFTGLQSNMALGRWWGGGMVSTPAQLLQTSLLFYRIAKQHGSGWGVLGGGLGGAHALSCCRLACSFSGIQNNTVLGGGGGGGMVSTPAQLLQTSLLVYRITK